MQFSVSTSCKRDGLRGGLSRCLFVGREPYDLQVNVCASGAFAGEADARRLASSAALVSAAASRVLTPAASARGNAGAVTGS